MGLTGSSHLVVSGAGPTGTAVPPSLNISPKYSRSVSSRCWNLSDPSEILGQSIVLRFYASSHVAYFWSCRYNLKMRINHIFYVHYPCYSIVLNDLEETILLNIKQLIVCLLNPLPQRPGWADRSPWPSCPRRTSGRSRRGRWPGRRTGALCRRPLPAPCTPRTKKE